MNLERLQNELALAVQDQSLEPFFKDWLNDAILELTGDFDFPALKRLTPVTLQVTTDNWIYAAPDSFHKKLFRCVNSNDDQVKVCRKFDELDYLDINHTATEALVTHLVAMELGMAPLFGIYPMANDTLRLWFYEKPALLEYPDDEPTFMPVEFHTRVLMPKVIVKNYRLIQDLAAQPPAQSLLYWENLVREGLYGSPRGEVGLVQKMALATKPKRHGGRDPISSQNWRR